MKSKPFFSITIPTYNRAGKLLVALESILAQDFNDYEVIVVDNNSNDETREVVMSLNDPRIKYFKNPVNIGIVKNVQKVIDFAIGEYILLHSDDDFLIKKDTLSLAYGLLKKNSYGVLRLHYLTKTPNDKKILLCAPHLNKDFKIKQGVSNKEIIDFCERIGTNFFTGIILKNNCPKYIRITDAEIGSWFNYCFYDVKKSGGYFLSNHFFLCSWSMSVIPGTYKMLEGKIPSELYLKNILDKIDYEEIGVQLDKYLINLITVFPAIKYFTDNQNLVKLSQRILELSPGYKYSVLFWYYLFIGLIAPKPLLHWYRFYRINNIKVDYKIKNLNKLKEELSSLNRKVQGNKIISSEVKAQLNEFLSFSTPSI